MRQISKPFLYEEWRKLSFVSEDFAEIDEDTVGAGRIEGVNEPLAMESFVGLVNRAVIPNAIIRADPERPWYAIFLR